MRRSALLVMMCSAACVDVTDDGGPWEPLAEVQGPLAAEIGPAVAWRTGPASTLRVATWNVHFGEDAEGLATAVRNSREVSSADVLLVQEIEAYPADLRSRSARFAGALGMTFVYAPARVEGDGTHGIAIFSRYPLESAAVRRLPHIDQPVRARERNAMSADVVIGEQRIRVINVHLDVRIGAGDRVRQLHPAVNDIPDDAIVGGDFNTNPWAWVEGLVPLVGVEAIVGQEQAAVIDDYLLGKDFASAIPIETATMRLPAFQMRTDDLYARGYEIAAAGVEHVDGSDHWPVWFDVSLAR